MDKRQKEMVRCARHALLALSELKCDLMRDLTYAKENGGSYTEYESYVDHLENIDFEIRRFYDVSNSVPTPKIGKNGKVSDENIVELRAISWPPNKRFPPWSKFISLSGLKGEAKEAALKCVLSKWTIGPGHNFSFVYPYGELPEETKLSIILGLSEAFRNICIEPEDFSIKFKCSSPDVVTII